MPVRLTTTITNISSVPNPSNRGLLYEFHQYMKSIGTSDSYQNGNLKIMIYFAKFLGQIILVLLNKASVGRGTILLNNARLTISMTQEFVLEGRRSNCSIPTGNSWRLV